jgi:hypothetical protein
MFSLLGYQGKITGHRSVPGSLEKKAEEDTTFCLITGQW